MLAKNKKFGVRNKARSWILHYNLYKARRSTLAKDKKLRLDPYLTFLVSGRLLYLCIFYMLRYVPTTQVPGYALGELSLILDIRLAFVALVVTDCCPRNHAGHSITTCHPSVGPS